MACLYQATVQKPTAISACVTGCFLKPDNLNLWVAKMTHLELHLISPEGLAHEKTFVINGSICHLKKIQPPGFDTDLLFIITNKYKMMILQCVEEAGDEMNGVPPQIVLKTIAKGNLKDRVGRPRENGILCVVDPLSRVIVVQLYDCYIKVVPIEDLKKNISAVDKNSPGQTLSEILAFNLKLDELDVVDIALLHDAKKYPTLGLVYRTSSETVNIKAYLIDVADKSFAHNVGARASLSSSTTVAPLANPYFWVQENVDQDIHLLIPVPEPYGGVLGIGGETVTYINKARSEQQDNLCSGPPILKNSPIIVWGMIDDHRYLLANEDGQLMMLILLGKESGPSSSSKLPAKNSIDNLQVEYLGDINVASNLTYLDNGVVFVGSRIGDSQLIRLTTQINQETNSNIQILENFTNIGPILDAAFVSPDQKGQTSPMLITCSNVGTAGTLRLIRSGVGINQHASADLPTSQQVKSLWSLQVNPMVVDTEISRFDDAVVVHDGLVVSFQNNTVFFAVGHDGEMELSTDIPGVDFSLPTILACNIACPSASFNEPVVVYCHVTRKTVCVTARIQKSGQVSTLWSSSWSCPTEITHATCVAGQIVIASGAVLRCLELTKKSVDEFTLTPSEPVTLPNQVACVDLDNDTGLLALGFWSDMNVRVLKMAQLFEPEANIALLLKDSACISTDQRLSRSVYFVRFEQPTEGHTPELFLLVSLADGSLLYTHTTQLSNARVKLEEIKRVVLGVRPLTLRKVNFRGVTNIFALSDRPAVIHLSNGKLVFSCVNITCPTALGSNSEDANHADNPESSPGTNMLSVTPFHHPSAGLTESLALATPNSLIFGSVDTLQKLFIQSIPLHESPRRLVVQQATNCVGVLSYRPDSKQERGQGDAGGVSSLPASLRCKNKSGFNPTEASNTKAIASATGEIHSLIIFQLGTMLIQHVHQFEPNECALAICPMELDGGKHVFAVGVAEVRSHETEPRHGSVILFSWDPCNQHLEKLSTTAVHGAPYQLLEFGKAGSKKLLATVNSGVKLFSISASTSGDYVLSIDASYYINVLALYARCRGDFVAVGDLMRSISLLVYKPSQSSFEEVARDTNANWMTSLEMLEDNVILGAEAGNNLFCCTRNVGGAALSGSSSGTTTTTGGGSNTATTAQSSTASQPARPGTNSDSGSADRVALEVTGAYHIGEQVNVIRKGQLSMRALMDSRTLKVIANPVIYGTVEGSLGLVCQLNPDLHAILIHIQNCLAERLQPVGHISHADWRQFLNDRRCVPASGFVDGDLVQAFSDLPEEDKISIIAGYEHREKLISLVRLEENSPILDVVSNTKDDAACHKVLAGYLAKIIDDLSHIH